MKNIKIEFGWFLSLGVNFWRKDGRYPSAFYIQLPFIIIKFFGKSNG